MRMKKKLNFYKGMGYEIMYDFVAYPDRRMYRLIKKYNNENFFSPPYVDDDVIEEVVDSLRSGWITTGPKVKALEEEIKAFSGAEQVLCVNSWTSVLL